MLFRKAGKRSVSQAQAYSRLYAGNILFFGGMWLFGLGMGAIGVTLLLAGIIAILDGILIVNVLRTEIAGESSPESGTS